MACNYAGKLFDVVLLVGDKAKILEGVKKTGYQVIEMDIDGNLK
jgi:hypothetical protein